MLFNLQLLVKKRMSGDERINAHSCVHIPDNRYIVSKSYSFEMMSIQPALPWKRLLTSSNWAVQRR